VSIVGACGVCAKFLFSLSDIALTSPAMFLALLASCSGTPPASSDSDASAKRFTPEPGKASLYIARTYDTFASLVPFPVTVDGKEIGYLGPGGYLLVPVGPGQHTVLVSSILNTDRAVFEASTGKNYFYEVQAVKQGAVAQAQLGIVLLEPMGRLMINQSKRVQDH